MNPASFDFDWELGLFKAVRALWRAVAGPPPTPWDPERAALLEGQEERLGLLGSLLAGQVVKVERARGEGGVRGSTLLLPPAIDLAPDPEANRGVYVLRVCMDATRLRLGVLEAEDGVERARRVLERELPRFGVAWDEVAARVPEEERRGLLWGRALEVERVDDQSPGVENEPTGPGSSIETERDAPGIEDLRVHRLDEDKRFELPIHAFEKVELLESFNGNLRQLDGEDELDAHLEALDEVDLKHLVRGGPDAGSIYHADVGLDVAIPDVATIEPGEEAILYPEWDARRGAYRPDWCAVYPTLLPRGGAGRRADPKLVRALHDRLLAHRVQRALLARQTDGEELDIDALVAARVELQIPRQPSDRLYLRRPRIRRDFATTVLLDISLSSDAWIGGRRVLDVAMEAVAVLGEVVERLGDRLEVLAFASHTRNRVRVFTVKRWDERWSVGEGRLALLRPQGYTRIGPALRHATASLRGVGARHKLLLLLSDGKPTDFDRYEGRYGVQDVRRALKEARDEGIVTHAFALASRPRPELATMFGAGRWTVLGRPDELPEAMALAYGRHLHA